MPAHLFSRNRTCCGTVSRRAFLASGLAAAAVPAIATPRPSEIIQIGVVGLGSRGFNLIDDFLKKSDCRIVAICDVDDHHHRDQAPGKGPAFGRQPAAEKIRRAYASPKSGLPSDSLAVYSDYRELIAHTGIDAVVVTTPDHWHALCTWEALAAGKDVYCEKPVTHLFAEGQVIVREVARRDAVFQTGSQQRSDPLFQRAVELARNGLLGDITSVEVGLPPGYDKPMGSTEILKPSAGLDYNFWCGPSPRLPLMQARHHRWWRGHRAYGGGVLMDWIGHHNDIAHWAIGAERSGPIEVRAAEWVYPETGIYNTPHTYTIHCQYESGVTSSISSQHRRGLKLISSAGWVFVKRGKIEASDARWLKPDFVPGTLRVGRDDDHAGDFLSCIRQRQECIAPAEIAHRSITPRHLGYVAAATGRTLRWAPQTESVLDDVDADTLLKSVNYRSPWIVPGS